MRKTAGITLALVAFTFPALAQDRDRGRDDWSVSDIMRSSDDNNDGTIEQSELGRTSGYYVRLAAQRIGLDPNGTLPADKIRAALEAMKAEGGGGSPGNSGSGSGNGPARPATPAPNGFGAPAAATPTKTPGFDVPLSVGASGPLDKRFDARVIEYVNDMIKERDANKNGILEKSEWTGRWSTPPEESDTNRDGILSQEELCVRIAKRFNISGSGSGGPPGNSGSGPSSGFGPPGGGGSGSGDSGRLRGYAESLIKQYDESKNGMLEKEEAKNLRSEHQAADANKDGVITLDELAAHLAAYSAGGSGGSPPGGSGSPGSPPGSSPSSSSSRWGDRPAWGSRPPSGSDKDKAAQTKKSYRFLSPTERLPKGMPDWFLRGDADADGQVSMVEYASAWSEQVAAEFLKYDLDGDGLITPEECQRVEKEKSARK
ncbi:MAG: hypothetical protein SFU86_19545 [Pirellulaceae bacterium]|nr:hypothetical protein [Pirellulaceae bacterium]